MLEERDTKAPAWGWLRGFGWFLLGWPLLSLYAVKELNKNDWESVVAGVFGPAAIGLVLLGVEAGLTRLFARRTGTTAQAVPSTLRDVANLAIALAILLVIDVGLVTLFDDDPMLRGGDPRAANLAGTMLAICAAVAIVFRGAARLVYGRARVVDMGEGWERAPVVMRFLGYLTLVPMLLVCTVMIDYTLHGKPDFGTTAWIVLPALLWLGLRSAMARAPRWWAHHPWEAWQRAISLALPWWLAALAAALGFVALCVLLPAGVIDATLTTRGRIAGWIVLGPLGLGVLVMTAQMLRRNVPALVRAWGVAGDLARGRAEVAEFGGTGT
ncbi:MAG TPA: hypothetical protein VIK91_08630, partial [Nannocystis sp.]